MITTLDPASITEAFDRADMTFWTRQAPRSDCARLRFLLTRTSGLDALAACLQTKEHVLSQVLAGNTPCGDRMLSLRICREVIRIWQPRVRKRAHQKLIAEDGSIGVHFRAKFGFTVSAGSSDDPRLRLMSIWLSPAHTASLLRARERGAKEQELHSIVESATGESYFRVYASRLRAVTLKEVHFIDFSFDSAGS